jgi:hypothetical protein
MSFNFSGFVALRRGLQEELQLGNLSNTEGLVLITLILNADAATGRGTINAPTLLSFLPDLLLSTAKDTLLSLQKKGHIWRHITPFSKRVYPYWVNGYEVSRGRYKGLRISLAEVFESKDISTIRYEHPAPHDQSETLPESHPHALPDIRPETPPEPLPDLGHNYNNDNNKDKYKDKNKDKNKDNKTTDQELIVPLVNRTVDHSVGDSCAFEDISPFSKFPSVPLTSQVPAQNVTDSSVKALDGFKTQDHRNAHDYRNEGKGHDAGTEGEAPPPIPQPPSQPVPPSQVSGTVSVPWSPVRFRPRSVTEANLVYELERCGMYLDEDNYTHDLDTHEIVQSWERKKRIRAYKENGRIGVQLQDLDPANFESGSVRSYE